MNKYKLVIFETNKNDGCMSLAKHLYPTNITEEEIKNRLASVKNKIGAKYNFDGKHILQPSQKDVEKNIDYPTGKYIKIDPKKLTKEDYWYEKLPCDILLITKENPNIVIGHRMADCPVIIAEDVEKQVAAVSHCGATQINRQVPIYTIKALVESEHSNPQNIHVYIGSCIKKESYQYDKYPAWATDQGVWKECISNKNNKYYIDLIKAIKNQLIQAGILNNNIKISPIDTYTNEEYYSHSKYVKGEEKDRGQNFVGCFYRKI